MDLKISERFHNAGGHSSQICAKQTVGLVKSLSSLNHPVGPSQAVSFADSSSHDLLNVCRHDIQQSEYDYGFQNAYILSDIF